MKKSLLTTLVLLIISSYTSFSQILFSETFSTNTLPAGWTNDSLGMPAANLWLFNNPYSRSISGLFLDANFAIFDSDEGDVDDGIDEDASLTTPLIDISSAGTSLSLELDEQLRGNTGIGGGTRMIEYSIDSGATWIMLDSTQDDLGYPNPAYHSVYDISSAIGSTSLMVRFHWNGSWDWWWAIDNVTVITKPDCVNPLNPGTAVSGSGSVCPDEYFFLYLTGDDQTTDATYQWQSSPDTVNWTDMVGNISNLEYVSQLSATYYRSATTCNGQTFYSAPVLVMMSIPTSCYCIGEFADGCDILDKVVFNTLSNIGSGCNGNANNYINYPDTGSATTTVYADSTYDLTIASGAGTGDHGAAAWFDFNQDGDFQDADEFYYISDVIPEASPDFTIAITIPTTAFGPTRMRVRYVFDNLMSQFSDCDAYGYGETEDYTVDIQNPTINVNEIDENDFNVYPSPVSDLLNIQSKNVKGQMIINLYDNMSRLCLTKTSESTGTQLDLSSFAKGLYILHINTGSGSVMKKIIVE